MKRMYRQRKEKGTECIGVPFSARLLKSTIHPNQSLCKFQAAPKLLARKAMICCHFIIIE